MIVWFKAWMDTLLLLDGVAFSTDSDQFYEHLKDRFIDVGLITYYI